MRYMVRTSVVHVIGRIWMPSTTAAMTYTLDSHDVENATDDDGKITRDSLQGWLDTHTGDFAEITDWSASIEPSDDSDTVDFDWTDEESEMIFGDCMMGDDDV